MNTSRTPSAKTPSDAGFDYATLLRSLRRRWIPCVLIGVPLAVALGFAAFVALPAPYVAGSEIFIKSFDDNLVFQTNEPQAQFHVRKETHQRMVTSSLVLTAALRNLDVPRLQFFSGVQNPVEFLESRLDVRRAGHEFFTISLSGEQPAELAKIVNAVTDAYMSEVVEAEVGKRRERLAELQKVADGVREDLQIKRQELRDLTKMSNSATTLQASQKQEHVLEMQVEVRKQITQVEMDLLRLRIRERLQGGEAEEEEKKEEQIPDAVLENLLSQEPEYQAAKARVEQMNRLVELAKDRFPPNHPGMADAEEKVAVAESKLASTAASLRPRIIERIEDEQNASAGLTSQQIPQEIEQLQLARAELDRELAQLKVNEQETGLYSLQIEEIVKELGRLEALSDTLSSEMERREFELKNARLPARVSEVATTPTTRSYKKKAVGVVGAAGGALALVVCGFVFFDMRGERISTRREISETLELPLIATILSLPRSATGKSSKSRRGRRKMEFWTSALKESVDAARTRLLSLAERDDVKVILIASAMPSEGKTTLSLHLATSLARAGRRVLLVDADLRRPSLSQVYGADGAGVCEIVRGEVALEDAIVASSVNGLSILPAGRLDDETLEQLARDGFESTLGELRSQWDFVIVDSSPVLPICDALLFASKVDSVIFAIRRDVSRRHLVAAALERFQAIGKPVLGAVAIGLNDDPASYRDLQRYQYGYARALVEC